MSTPEITFQALLTDWDRLPGRVGDDWEELLPDIQRLIDAIAMSDDEDERALLADELLTCCAPTSAPGATSAPVCVRSSSSAKRCTVAPLTPAPMPQAPDLLTLATELFARMPFEASAMDFEAAFSLDPEPVVLAVTRYTDISCPRRVWLETPRFPVIVRLTVEMPELSAAVLDLQVHADEEAPVLVQCSAPGFDLLAHPCSPRRSCPMPTARPWFSTSNLPRSAAPLSASTSSNTANLWARSASPSKPHPTRWPRAPNLAVTNRWRGQVTLPHPTSSSISPTSPTRRRCVSPCCGMVALPGRPFPQKRSTVIRQLTPPNSTAASPLWPAKTTPRQNWRTAPSAL